MVDQWYHDPTEARSVWVKTTVEHPRSECVAVRCTPRLQCCWWQVHPRIRDLATEVGVKYSQVGLLLRVVVQSLETFPLQNASFRALLI